MFIELFRQEMNLLLFDGFCECKPSWDALVFDDADKVICQATLALQQGEPCTQEYFHQKVVDFCKTNKIRTIYHQFRMMRLEFLRMKDVMDEQKACIDWQEIPDSVYYEAAAKAGGDDQQWTLGFFKAWKSKSLKSPSVK
jgi:hypothetical protein